MPLTAKDAFRLGFLLRCAEDGRTPEQIRGMTKQAGIGTEWFKGLMNLGTGAGKLLYKAPLYAGGWLLAGGAATGALAGHTAAKLTEADIDPEETKRQELLAAYKRHAEIARRRAGKLSYRAPKPSRFSRADLLR